jgi:transposase
MPQPNDLSRSLVALDQDSTIIAVVEMSQSSWLVAGMLPGIERQPRNKFEPSPERLLALLHRWRDEAIGAGKEKRGCALRHRAREVQHETAREDAASRRCPFKPPLPSSCKPAGSAT